MQVIRELHLLNRHSPSHWLIKIHVLDKIELLFCIRPLFDFSHLIFH